MTTDELDTEGLGGKYAQERNRRLRSDARIGMCASTTISSRPTIPTPPAVEPEPKTGHVTVAFIGGGISGLLTGARLKDAGVEDIRIIDKAGAAVRWPSRRT